MAPVGLASVPESTVAGVPSVESTATAVPFVEPPPTAVPSVEPIAGGLPVPLLIESASSLPLARVFLLATAAFAVGTLVWLSRPAETWYAALRRRLLWGVPWGTLVVVAGLLAAYYGLQGGLADPDAPVVLPFRAWSYLDPFGMAFASFTHASLGHLVGNLPGTLVFGSLAEYVWGHHVDRSTGGLGGRLWTTPAVRAFVVFPAVVVAVGLLGALVALGPVIGFSTVVFAFVGFTLVRRPLGTVLAGVSAGALGTLLAALRRPAQVYVAETGYEVPWFASVAVQAHAVGFLIGLLVGLALMRSREVDPPSATRLWAGTLLVGLGESLWAVYWFRGTDTYVLYRAVGVGLVFLLVVVVTYAVVAADRPLFPTRAVAAPRTLRSALASITGREVGLLVLVCAAAALVGPAVAVNLTTADDAALPGEPIEIRGYEVTYGEDVPDGQLGVVDVEAAGETTRQNTSGVIVRNADRHVWTTAITRGELAEAGERRLRLGGVGWRETVTVTREGWDPVGNDTVYRVRLTADGERRVAYASPAVRAEPTVDGATVALAPTAEGFEVAAIVDDDRVDTAAVPDANGSVALPAAGLTVVREDDRLLVVADDTTVRVATRE